MKDEFEDFQAQIKRLTEQNRVARKILGVSASDDKVAVKKAFRHLAAKYHPDKNPGDEKALRRFKETVGAYEYLQGKRDSIVSPEELEADAEMIGKYQANDWGYYCHWKEAFMDDFLGTDPRKKAPDEDK